MDKFLKGEDNKWKEHPNYINYKYEFLDKSFPTAEQAHTLITKAPEVAPRRY